MSENQENTEKTSELPPEFKSDMVAQLNQPLEQLHDSLESCARFLVGKYKLDSAVIERCISELAAGFVIGRLHKKIGLRPDELMTTLAKHLLGECEQIRLMDELRASLNRESIKTQLQSLKDQGIQEGLKLAKIAAVQFDTQPRQSLLDICREFDAIDLSECNRRLEAGEPFDAACDETMEKRQALGEQIKERLGADWVTFEAYAEIATPRDSAEAALWSLADAISDQLSGFIVDEDAELARPPLTRLGVLLS